MKLAEVLHDNVPDDNKCPNCGSELVCLSGYNSSPFSVYVHQCSMCSNSYIRIINLSDAQDVDFREAIS